MTVLNAKNITVHDGVPKYEGCVGMWLGGDKGDAPPLFCQKIRVKSFACLLT